MNAADDKSLLAMKAARMSTASIAFTMGWSKARVERRLEELAAEAAPAVPAEAVVVPLQPVTPERKPVPANPVGSSAPPLRGRIPEPMPKRPLRAGEGVVDRTFQTRDGCGAAVRLGDGRTAFTECGTRDLEPGRVVKVQPAEGCFHLVPERADA